jgi:putative phosphonate metabolism protein
VTPGERYAVYFAPAAGSAWWTFGARWLGRDECSGVALPQKVPPGFDAEAFRGLTEQPRRYGFHATLKAPMRLLVDEATLLARVDRLARSLHRRALTPVPVCMDGFLALVPAARDPALSTLAALCVTELDDLRAPLTREERARRRPESLDDRGCELLDRWGYAGVLERFRFHLTLTGRCDAATAGRLVALVAPEIAALERTQPLVLDRLCVFHEPAPGADLTRIHEVQLGA